MSVIQIILLMIIVGGYLIYLGRLCLSFDREFQKIERENATPQQASTQQPAIKGN